MARISIEDLTVTSFVTGTEPQPWDGDVLAAASGHRFCICTADFSTCSRTSPQGGCDTSVQCVTG
jgi:hypothetical protein